MDIQPVRRFWDKVRIVENEGGFSITLDDKLVHTPGKRILVVPNHALAEALSTEWNSQNDTVEPGRIPLTRHANSTIDSGVLRRAEVIEEVVRYGATDLVCYRATDPPELIERQIAGWHPLVEWISSKFKIRLQIVSSILPVAQSRATIDGFRIAVSAFDDFPLTGLHAATAACGSLVIALGLAHGQLNAEVAWSLSQLDETYQLERWGQDAEAVNRRARLLTDIEVASQFMVLSGMGE